MKANTRIELFIKQLPLVAAAFFAAVLCVSTATAGMEPKSMEIPQPEPFTWTGFYFDLGAGVVVTNFDQGDYETVVDLVDQFDNRVQAAGRSVQLAGGRPVRRRALAISPSLACPAIVTPILSRWLALTSAT